MSVLVYGDTHGAAAGDAKKLNNDEVWKACGDKYPDFVIVCGDFGFIFAPEWDERKIIKERYYLKWLEDKPWITLFARGNHDNIDRLNKLPSAFMFGSEVGVVNKKVFWLKDGRVYTIDNKSFFVMGGAASIDKEYRIPEVSWWEGEQGSYADFYRGLKSIEKVNGKVDYVISHTCPSYIKPLIYSWKIDFNDSTEAMLDSLDEKLEYKCWFFGHHHQDLHVSRKGKNYSCLYHKGVFIE